ncbi:chitin elicitor receptor kinase 1 [Carica papaya]|uniref:chitin elicitor receptor kinase 1 n=1 Tax=Carica papaya TaxID=3649 RepID=UPI000B8CC97E|nr:chitin elicitor receptor kinase 1 [Carica papaya]
MVVKLGLAVSVLLLLSVYFLKVESKCSRGCGLALASYFVWPGSNLTFISEVLQSSVAPLGAFDVILSFNKNVSNKDSVQAFTRVDVPFPCDCINGEFLGHVFEYNVRSGDTYDKVANPNYSNLTTPQWLERFNSFKPNLIPDTAQLNVTVNCSCGDSSVSDDFGLFVTYPLRPEDSLTSIASQTNLSADLLQRYNREVNFSQGSGLVFIPGKDASGQFPPLHSSKGISGGVIAGICIAVAAGVLLVAFGTYFVFYRRKRVKGAKLLSTGPHYPLAQHVHAPGSEPDKITESTGPTDGVSPGITAITVDKSVEFSYEELATATSNFSIANKIGEGGFGSVYYAELRGEKAAIKKMDMQASREFLAELKVLTHVHHLNLVMDFSS